MGPANLIRIAAGKASLMAKWIFSEMDSQKQLTYKYLLLKVTSSPKPNAATLLISDVPDISP
jgi:hypothetical protein